MSLGSLEFTHSGINYGLLKSRPTDRLFGSDQTNQHYQIHAIAGTAEYRVAVNVQSQDAPSTLLYFVNENFQHPIIDRLANTDWGFQLVAKQPDGLALDFVRGNLFDVSPTISLTAMYRPPSPIPTRSSMLSALAGDRKASPISTSTLCLVRASMIST